MTGVAPLRLGMRAASLAAALAVAAAGSCQCPGPFTPIAPSERIDTFTQKDAARVDVLWVVDNSGSMQAEQQKLAERFADFFRALVVSHVDYHIGVVSSDAREGGVLRAYAGAPVRGCDGCRFLTNAVPCANPSSTTSDGCAAAGVFADLVQTGTGGSPVEELFAQAAAALGIDPSNPGAAPAPSAENAGFVRDDASLYIVFVTDEDDRDSSEVGFTQRLFEGLKGAGNENKVTVAGIVGFPEDAPAPIGDVCAVLDTTFDADPGDDDPRAAPLLEALRATGPVCRDRQAADGAPNSDAQNGARILELACRTGGVVADICSADYGAALDALGADAAGLLRTFSPSVPVAQIQWGADCTPGTGDDVNLDCDDDGRFDGPLDGPLCVTAAGLPLAHPGADCAPTGEPELVPRSQSCGWQLEPDGAIRFPGAFVPRPGSEVDIRYGLSATCAAR